MRNPRLSDAAWRRPLPGELLTLPYSGVNDATNLPNDYQGSLRFAWLDLNLLRRAIAADLAGADRVPGLMIESWLAIGCLDQLGKGPAIYHYEGCCCRV